MTCSRAALPAALLAVGLLATLPAVAGEGVGVIPRHRLVDDGAGPDAPPAEAPTLWLEGQGSTVTLWLVAPVTTSSIVEVALPPGWVTSEPVVSKQAGGVGTIPRMRLAHLEAGYGDGDAPADEADGEAEATDDEPAGPGGEPGVFYGPVVAQAGEPAALVTLEGAEADLAALVFTIVTTELPAGGTVWTSQVALADG